MSLQFIIDGYNLIRHPLVAAVAEKEKDPCLFLINFIKSNNLSGSANNNVIIVFDGYRRAGRDFACPVGFQIIFSGAQSADDRIRQITEKLGGGRNTVVVSDDNEVRFAARLFKAQPIAVQEFIRYEEKEAKRSASAATKPEITYSQIQKINAELRKLWLGQ